MTWSGLPERLERLIIPEPNSGCWLWLGYGFSGQWLNLKLGCVAILFAYHVWCGVLLRDFKHDRNAHSHVWYRWFNEFPVLILFAVVILVVVKPF
jgi:putative membrane protein